MPRVENRYPALPYIVRLEESPEFRALHKKDPLNVGFTFVLFRVYVNAAAGQYISFDCARRISGLSESDFQRIREFFIKARMADAGRTHIVPSSKFLRSIERFYAKTGRHRVRQR